MNKENTLKMSEENVRQELVTCLSLNRFGKGKDNTIIYGLFATALRVQAEEIFRVLEMNDLVKDSWLKDTDTYKSIKKRFLGGGK